jgi:hypothetical protein
MTAARLETHRAPREAGRRSARLLEVALQGQQIALGQVDQRGADVLPQVLDRAGAGDEKHDGRALEQPGEEPRRSPMAIGAQGMNPIPASS